MVSKCLICHNQAVLDSEGRCPSCADVKMAADLGISYGTLQGRRYKPRVNENPDDMVVTKDTFVSIALRRRRKIRRAFGRVGTKEDCVHYWPEEPCENGMPETCDCLNAVHCKHEVCYFYEKNKAGRRRCYSRDL